MAHIIHACAKNDAYGNPRRIYVLIDGDNLIDCLMNKGGILASWDEGYNGNFAVPGLWREKAWGAESVDITVNTYQRLMRDTIHPKWADEVPGFAHVREYVT